MAEPECPPPCHAHRDEHHPTCPNGPLPPYVETTCPTSKRVDGATLHSTRFDGDNPYTICVYCGEMRDAISGRIVRAASQPAASYASVTETDTSAQTDGAS